MFISKNMEADIDRQWAPHQFSADYGAVQDDALNEYINGVGNDMAALTHRPDMPYNFRGVNAVVVNAYTFPAGSVAVNRGLILALKNESELAAVLGHEMGHVNARHAGERMTKNIIAMALVSGLNAYLEHEGKKYADLAAGLGAIGANMLLSRYSRDDEREADSLGMEYMTRGEHNPNGMVGVMETFTNLGKHKPNIVEVLFSTHPMSEARYKTALAKVQGEYSYAASNPDNKERYMDNTAGVRDMRSAIEKMQTGNDLMMEQKYAKAEAQLRDALKEAPDDYAGLLMTSKACLAQKKYAEARRLAERAKEVYPEEAHAVHVTGMADLQGGKYENALVEFDAYEKLLPGNANTIFFKGQCLDKMGRKTQAAREYKRYQQSAPDGEFSGRVRTRLAEWGYTQSES